MIKPTVGRVVWFRERPPKNENEQPQAAIVTFVHSDTSVNLAVHDKNGNTSSMTSVRLRQPDEPAPDGPYCEWMPYQMGQAAKAEQAEAVAEAARRGFKGER